MRFELIECTFHFYEKQPHVIKCDTCITPRLYLIKLKDRTR